jgi:hypothetical protein
MMTAMKWLSIRLLTVTVLATLAHTCAAGAHSFVQQAKLAPPVGASSIGGFMAIAGNTAVAGAPVAKVGGRGPVGLVYVYVRPKSGWSGQLRPVATLEASDGRRGDEFGESVSIWRDTVVVGAPKHRIGTRVVPGVAYVFVRPASGWAGTLTESAELMSTHAIAGFGANVAVWGANVVVGAPDPAGNGVAYVFVRPVFGWAGSLMQNATLTASNGAANDAFGQSVAIDRTTIIIGAPGHNAEHGMAYAYTMPASGWAGSLTENQKLFGGKGAGAQLFGWSVAVGPKRILVGAPFYEAGKNMDQGAAYAYAPNKSGWRLRARLVAFNSAAFDELGISVGLSAPLALAGALHNGFGLNLAPGGAAYVYTHWTPVPSITPGGKHPPMTVPNLKPIAKLTHKPFGLNGVVAISGGTILAGANSGLILVYVET